MLLVISCEKDLQLCSDFIKKGFGKLKFCLDRIIPYEFSGTRNRITLRVKQCR